MNAAVALLGVVVPALTAANLLRALLHRPPRQLPEPRDGIAVTTLETDPVAHPQETSVRRSWRKNVIALAFCVVFFTYALPVARGQIPLLFVVLAVESVLVVPWLLYQVFLRRPRPSGEPVHSFSVQLQLTGPADALAARLRRAFLELRAISVSGSTVLVREEYLVVEGGTGWWGIDGDAGYQLRATATYRGDHWDVTLESCNYVRTLFQDFRNTRNVAKVMGALLA